MSRSLSFEACFGRHRFSRSVAGVLFLAGVLFSLLWSPSPNLVVVHASSESERTNLQLYRAYDWPYLDAFKEYSSSRRFLHRAESILPVPFNLPPIPHLSKLRLDFENEPGEVIRVDRIDLCFRSVLGTWRLGVLDPETIRQNIVGESDLERVSVQDGTLIVQTRAGDPYFVFALNSGDITSEVDLATSIVLRGQWLLGFCLLAILVLLGGRLWDANLRMPGDKTIYLGFFLLLCVCAFIVYAPVLVGPFYYLYADVANDSIHAFWPNFMHLSDYLRTDGLPFWTFHSGVGQNFFGWIGDPFLFVHTLFPSEMIAELFGWMQFLKVVLAGILFFLWFQLCGLSRYVSAVFALCLAFSAHMVIRGNWYHYSSEVVVVAFALVAVEMILRRKSWKLLPLAVFLLVGRGAYHACVWSLIFGVYVLLRIWSDANDNSVRTMLTRSVQVLGAYLLGLALSAVLFLPNLYRLLTSGRVQSESDGFRGLAETPIFSLGSPLEWLSGIAGLFAPDMIGRGKYYSGWGNYLEGPHFYGGVICLLLIPQVFQGRSGRQKIAISIGLAAVLAYLFVPYFRFFLNGFAGLYFKTSSFWVTLVLCGLSAVALDTIIREGKLRRIAIVITLAGSLFLLDWLRNSDFASAHIWFENTPVIYFQAAFLLLTYTVLIVLVSKRKSRGPAAILLAAVVVFEIVSYSYRSTNDRYMIRKDVEETGGLYFDDSDLAVNVVQSSDPGFYRVEKAPTSVHFNDALAQGYRGLRSYNSFNPASYLRFLGTEGFSVDYQHRNLGTSYIAEFRGRVVLETLLSVKYYILSGKERSPPPLYAYWGRANDATIFQNECFVPFGFVYSRTVVEQQVEDLAPEERDLVALSAGILAHSPEPVAHSLNQAEMERILAVAESGVGSDPWVKFYRTRTERLAARAIELHSFTNNGFEGSIELSEEGLLFLSIPAEEGWSFRVNGRQVDPLVVNFGFTGISLDAGTSRIEASYFPPLLSLGMMISACGLVIFAGVALAERCRNPSQP